MCELLFERIDKVVILSKVLSLIKINIKNKIRKPYIAAEEYEDLRQFYTALVAKMGEQIVLSKT